MQSGADVLALLRELAREGRAIVLVTHERSAAAIADRVLRLESGRLVERRDRREGALRAARELLAGALPRRAGRAPCSPRSASPPPRSSSARRRRSGTGSRPASTARPSAPTSPT